MSGRGKGGKVNGKANSRSSGDGLQLAVSGISDFPVTETETTTEMLAFGKTHTETETINILNTNTV